jgi:hypothetical protein
MLMINSVNTLNAYQSANSATANRQEAPARKSPLQTARDAVEIGKGKPLSNDQSMQVVLERAMEKLRAVVDQARAELGLPEGAVIDTSPDATAQRIADFALGFFSKYADRHGLADDEAGRQQFAGFIGRAIQQGIEEARGILTALNSLNGDVDNNINKTWEVIQNRLNGFVKNGLSSPDKIL